MRLLLTHGVLLMSTAAQAQPQRDWKIVIHGGAGTIERSKMTPQMDAAIRAALMTAAARLRDRQHLATEAASLEADEHDRAEMRAVAELMEQLRA